MMLSIDPGLNHVGWALWTDDGRLNNAGLARAPKEYVHERLMNRVSAVAEITAEQVHEACFWGGERHRVNVIVVEVPQVYRAARSKGDPNDLISIALVAGAVAGYFPNARWYGVRPREWKGTLNGDVMAERIRASCSITELGYFSDVPKSLQHNVLDATGIGRWWIRNQERLSCE